MADRMEPKVLIISNNCFSSGGSNGKVLKELFSDWSAERLAQFYIYDEIPEFSVCKNYYRVTDKEALNAFLTGKKVGTIVKQDMVFHIPNRSTTNNSRIQRNPLTCLIRDVVWNYGRWKNKEFWKWIEEFTPELILLQVGDSSFTANLAMKISKKYNVPIVLYNTENYYFKSHNYFLGEKHACIYPIFRWQLRRSFTKIMKMSKSQIYNSELLANLHEKEFDKKGYVIYQATSLKQFKEKTRNKIYKYTYAGNLGLNRHKSLIEIARVLQKISSNYYLDIYGRATDEVITILNNEQGIRYHGMVSYDELTTVLKNSDFLFHAESFETMIVRDLETAFSTKIADSLVSGKCFVLYADKSLACTQYLQKNACAYVITEPEKLESELKRIIETKELQMMYIKKALEIAQKNHNAEKNSIEFKRILSEIVCK